MRKHATKSIEKFVVRFPNRMRGQIDDIAKQSRRRMNSKIVSHIKFSLDREYVEEKCSTRDVD